MICLTGDVHQQYNGAEQQLYEGSEVDAALEYVDIAQRYNIELTLFLTGKVVHAERNKVDIISGKDHVELGGHTWSAFRPRWLHTLFQRGLNSIYGPKLFQRIDIWRTLRTLRQLREEPITAWRTHSYQSTETTYEILSGSSVRIVSDQKDVDAASPYEYEDYDLIELPINIITDHEHLYHGARTYNSVQANIDNGWSDTFGPESYEIAEWTDKVIAGIDQVEQADGIATLLIHPACMKVADDLQHFEQICAHISDQGYETYAVSDIVT